MEEHAIPMEEHDHEHETNEMAIIHEHAKLRRYKAKNCCERNCCGGLINMPCGYPPGTIRAIMTIIIVSLTITAECATLVYAVVNKDSTLINIAITVLSNSLTAVISFYFGTRSSSKPEPEKPPIKLVEGAV